MQGAVRKDPFRSSHLYMKTFYLYLKKNTKFNPIYFVNSETMNQNNCDGNPCLRCHGVSHCQEILRNVILPIISLQIQTKVVGFRI